MNDLLTYLITPAAQVAMIIGIAEVFKKVGFPIRFIPILDVAFGLLSGIFVYGWYLGNGIPAGIIIGLGIGLSACGTFSGIKNLFEKHESIEIFEEEDEDDERN